MASILSDEAVFAQFSGDSLKAYQRCWAQLKDLNPGFDFEASAPGEELLSSFFKHLRFEEKAATSTLWTKYSYVNSVMKRKYSVRLQEFPRITLLIKGFEQDVKNKAAIFEEDTLKQFMLAKMETAYWLVRQAICIVAFFGGLRMQECLDLCLEKIQRGQEGYFIRHSRVKQRRSDKLETKFLVPDDGGYGSQLALYLGQVNNDLNKFQGRVWWTAKNIDLDRMQSNFFLSLNWAGRK